MKETLKTTDDNIIFWENLQSPTNNGSLVQFEDVSFTRKGKYYFLISEDQSGKKENEVRDETKYLIECTVDLRTEDNKTILFIDPNAPLTYYKVLDEDNLIEISDLLSSSQENTVIGKKAQINPDAVEELEGTLVWHEDTGLFETDITYANVVENTETGMPVARKVLRDGQMYIQIGENIYTLTGNKVQ